MAKELNEKQEDVVMVGDKRYVPEEKYNKIYESLKNEFISDIKEGLKSELKQVLAVISPTNSQEHTKSRMIERGPAESVKELTKRPVSVQNIRNKKDWNKSALLTYKGKSSRKLKYPAETEEGMKARKLITTGIRDTAMALRSDMYSVRTSLYQRLNSLHDWEYVCTSVRKRTPGGKLSTTSNATFQNSILTQGKVNEALTILDSMAR